MFLFIVSENLSMICYVEIDCLMANLGFHNEDQYSKARMTRIITIYKSSEMSRK
jgi:hypothetical protein